MNDDRLQSSVASGAAVPPGGPLGDDLAPRTHGFTTDIGQGGLQGRGPGLESQRQPPRIGQGSFPTRRTPDLPRPRPVHQESNNTVPAFVIGIGAGFVFGWLFGRGGQEHQAARPRYVVRRRTVVRGLSRPPQRHVGPDTDWRDYARGPRFRSEDNWDDTAHEPGWQRSDAY